MSTGLYYTSPGDTRSREGSGQGSGLNPPGLRGFLSTTDATAEAGNKRRISASAYSAAVDVTVEVRTV